MCGRDDADGIVVVSVAADQPVCLCFPLVDGEDALDLVSGGVLARITGFLGE